MRAVVTMMLSRCCFFAPLFSYNTVVYAFLFFFCLSFLFFFCVSLFPLYYATATLSHVQRYYGRTAVVPEVRSSGHGPHTYIRTWMHACAWEEGAVDNKLCSYNNYYYSCTEDDVVLDVGQGGV